MLLIAIPRWAKKLNREYSPDYFRRLFAFRHCIRINLDSPPHSGNLHYFPFTFCLLRGCAVSIPRLLGSRHRPPLINRHRIPAEPEAYILWCAHRNHEWKYQVARHRYHRTPAHGRSLCHSCKLSVSLPAKSPWDFNLCLF